MILASISIATATSVLAVFGLPFISQASANVLTVPSKWQVPFETFCSANIECGLESNSVCYEGKCQCKLGFTWNVSKYSCQQMICTADDDQCQRFFANTACQLSQHSCICRRDFSLNELSQVCVSLITTPSSSIFFFIPISIVILLVLLAGGCGHLCYIRFLKEAISMQDSEMTANPASTSTVSKEDN